MTVQENVVAPLPDAQWRTMLADVGRRRTRPTGPASCWTFVGLARFADQPAGALSYGQQKLVELAQVLMLEPQLVLLDEPAGGVNPSLVGRMVEIVRDLNRQGITFLVVEHNIPMVLELCDPVVRVLAAARPIAEGPPQTIREDPVVLDAYLGDEWRPPAVANRRQHRRAAGGALMLTADRRRRRLRRRRRPAGRRPRAAPPGPSPASSGPNGAGKSTVLRVISGLLTPSARAP